MAHISPTRRRLMMDKEQVIAAYSHLSLRALSELHNTSVSALRAFLIEEGVTIRRAGNPRSKEKQDGN